MLPYAKVPRKFPPLPLSEDEEVTMSHWDPALLKATFSNGF